MKRHPIRNTLLACTLLLAACTKGPADADPQPAPGGIPEDNPYAGTVDTTGIVVPEGYTLVAFPGADTPETRAAVTGNDARITQLQYLLYQEMPRGSGVYKLRQRRTVFGASDAKTWPRKAETMVLPNDERFRVVFLGNADKSLFGGQEVLTGVTGGDSLYTGVRLHLPVTEFTDNTMYYMDKADFSSDDAGAGRIIYVPILMQRIVSRIDVRKQSLPAGTAVGTTAATYKRARLKYFVDTYLTDEMSSTARGSFYHRGLTASVDRCVMGLVYVATRGDLSDKADALFASGSNPYTVLRFRHSSADNTLSTEVKTRLDNESLTPTYRCTTDDFDDNILLRLAQYLYDFFHEVPAGVAADELTAANDKLTPLIKQYSDVTVSGSKDSHQPYLTQMPPLWYDSFAAGVGVTRQTGTDAYVPYESVFNPLMSYNYPAVNVVVNRMPESVDLDLAVRDYLADTQDAKEHITLSYKLKPWAKSIDDIHFSIIGLGTMAGVTIDSIRFALSGTGLLAPGTPATILTADSFTAGDFAPNELRRAEWQVTNVGLKSGAAPNPAYSLNAYLDRLNAMFLDGVNYDGPVYQPVIIKALGMNSDYSLGVGGYNWDIWLNNKGYYLCKDYFINSLALPSTDSAPLNRTKLAAAIKGVMNQCWNNPATAPTDAWSATMDIPAPLFTAADVTWTTTWSVTKATR